MNAGAAGDAPPMLPVTRAAAETFRKKEPAAAAPVPGASSKMDRNVKPKTSAAADAAGAGAPPPTAGGTEAFSSRPKLPRTPHAGSASSSRSDGGGTTPRTHGVAIRRRTPLRSSVRRQQFFRIRGRALRVVRRPLLQQTASTGLPIPNRKSLIQEYTN